jgi:hypothetical protein
MVHLRGSQKELSDLRNRIAKGALTGKFGFPAININGIDKRSAFS